VTATYTPASGRPKVFTGSIFEKKPLKVYVGSPTNAFVEKPVSVWTGTEWKKMA
jgi:hypothetical protein